MSKSERVKSKRGNLNGEGKHRTKERGKRRRFRLGRLGWRVGRGKGGGRTEGGAYSLFMGVWEERESEGGGRGAGGGV